MLRIGNLTVVHFRVHSDWKSRNVSTEFSCIGVVNVSTIVAPESLKRLCRLCYAKYHGEITLCEKNWKISWLETRKEATLDLHPHSISVRNVWEKSVFRTMAFMLMKLFCKRQTEMYIKKKKYVLRKKNWTNLHLKCILGKNY